MALLRETRLRRGCGSDGHMRATVRALRLSSPSPIMALLHYLIKAAPVPIAKGLLLRVDASQKPRSGKGWLPIHCGGDSTAKTRTSGMRQRRFDDQDRVSWRTGRAGAGLSPLGGNFMVGNTRLSRGFADSD